MARATDITLRPTFGALNHGPLITRHLRRVRRPTDGRARLEQHGTQATPTVLCLPHHSFPTTATASASRWAVQRYPGKYWAARLMFFLPMRGFVFRTPR